jgi:hypothetical protein
VSTSSVADPALPPDGDEGDDRTPVTDDGDSPESAPKEPHGVGTVLRRGTLLSLLVAVVLTLTLEVSALWRGDPRWISDQFVNYVGFYVD